MIAQACGLLESNHDPSADTSQAAGSAGHATGGTHSGGSGGSGTLTLDTPGGASSAGLPNDCPTDILFADQVVDQVGTRRVFYSWTTDEQVTELRAGTELFSRSERPGMGRGLLFTELVEYAQAGTMPANALADVLANQTFAKARFAWPNPWSTLMGFPGETYGNQLLRIELKADAWIARFDRGVLSVLGADNQLVPIETALASPERIGAIFYQSRATGVSCVAGTFSHGGGVGFREFALGNIDMVERWSLATPEIAERLATDIAELKAFEAQVACLSVSSSWSSDVACEWEHHNFADHVLSNYEFALGLPSELYLPNPENIAALLAALEMSKPTGEPLDVTPGK
jgi:hypothetical protein